MTTPRFTGGPPPQWARPPVTAAAAPRRKPTVWAYSACYVVNVHDADTLTVDIDMGQGIWSLGKAVRLLGCAARELRDPGGPEAAAYVTELCPVGSLLRVDSHQWDKFGRLLGVVYLVDGRVLQSHLIAEGWAAAWDGRGVQPKPPWPRERLHPSTHPDEPDS